MASICNGIALICIALQVALCAESSVAFLDARGYLEHEFRSWSRTKHLNLDKDNTSADRLVIKLQYVPLLTWRENIHFKTGNIDENIQQNK